MAWDYVGREIPHLKLGTAIPTLGKGVGNKNQETARAREETPPQVTAHVNEIFVSSKLTNSIKQRRIPRSIVNSVPLMRVIFPMLVLMRQGPPPV